MDTLYASRCTLEPQVLKHAAEMFRVLSDPAIYEFENTPPPSAAWLEERYRRLESRKSPNGSEHWLNWVIRLSSGQLAGYVQATVQESRIAYIAYELNSAHWRKGIGKCAVEAMLQELCRSHGALEFVAVLKARNFRSMALLRSLDFTPADMAKYEHEEDEIVMSKRAPVEPRLP